MPLSAPRSLTYRGGIGDFVTGMPGMLSDMAGSLGSAGKQLLDGLGGAASAFTNFASNAVGGLTDALSNFASSPMVAGIGNTISSVVGGTLDLVSSGVNSIMGALNSEIPEIKDWLLKRKSALKSTS